MHVTMMQHAVGQGGLFSGLITAREQPLRWLYDCGSNQRDALAREINIVAVSGDIDLLFLSHLDSDHVCGLDQLLLQVKVREVVMPYLDEAAVIAIVARDAARGVLTGLFVEAVRDIAGWFGRRGVNTVTFVNGRGDEEGGGDGPILPGAPEDGGEGDIQAKWTRKPRQISRRAIESTMEQVDIGKAATMQEVEPDAALSLYVQSSQLNWVLIPYVHVPSARLMTAFERALEAEFGTPLDKKQIVRSAQDFNVRKKLRACYDALWFDHNLISMTLYSGPRKHHAGNSFVEINTCGPQRLFQYFRGSAGGWMLTGDAHLDRKRRRKLFLDFYKNYLPLTNVLMLPHHGSIHNHSTFVLGAMSELRVGYAASGPNSYGHPHHDVRDDVDAHHRALFHCVTQRRSSRLLMQVLAS